MPKTKPSKKQLLQQQKNKTIALENSRVFSTLQKHPDRRALRRSAHSFWKKLTSDLRGGQMHKARFVAQIMIAKLRIDGLQSASSCAHGCGCHSC